MPASRRLDDNDISGLELVAALHADAEGALAALTALSSAVARAGGTPIAAPVQAGDAMVALRIPQVSGGSSKAAIDQVIVYWLHGPVLLEASLVAATDVLSDDFIAGFVQLAEAAYLASAFGTVSTPPAPAAPTPAPTVELQDLVPLP